VSSVRAEAVLLPDKVSGTCPVCGSADVTVYREGTDRELSQMALGPSRRDISGGRILRCRSCRLGFRATLPSEEDLGRLYRELDIGAHEGELPARFRTAARQLRIVSRYVAPARLLDVGCGSGVFLRVAADAGWNVVGVEPGKAAHRSATALLGGRGDVIHAAFQEVSLASSAFDVVTLWDVLEHVPDPRSLLDRAAHLVKPGGYLFVNVPDLESLPTRLLQARWPLLLPEHLVYFSRRSLRLCGEGAGLTLVHLGRRLVSFSIGYVFHRLAQHGVMGAMSLGRLARWGGIDEVVVSMPLGELCGIWRRHSCGVDQRNDGDAAGGQRS
jgi:SAM-dependent methyltransferase